MLDRERLTYSKRIIVKIGTTSITYPNGKINLRSIEKIAWTLSDLHNMGKEIILVSSGAIAVGAERLTLPERPRDIRGKQAASAVGQAILMQMYENLFMQYNQKVAQILLTKDVFENEDRKQNAKNTFYTLLEWGVIPIVNENDTVSVDELGFSDNDSLSSYVSCLVEGDLLIMLSDIDGLYDSNPKINKEAKLIKKVETVDGYIKSIAGESAGSLGTGGMSTKISAAQTASLHGIDTVIAKGDDATILFDILEGKDVGTLICSQKKQRM